MTSNAPAPDGQDGIDDRWRGFPTGEPALPAAEVGERGWRPQDGQMSLPLLSLDLDAFAANTRAVMRHVSEAGALIAPHAKTPMSVALARQLVAAGAWGATVADARQASVMLEGGVTRLILANQVGGHGAARRLAGLLRRHPQAEVQVFVDSLEGVQALAAAWRESAGKGEAPPPLGLLIELGVGRAGLRDDRVATDLMHAILALPGEGRLHLSGVAGYEGAAAVPDADETRRRIDDLLRRMREFHAAMRARLGPDAPLLLTAGGSLWFDRVLAALGPAAAADGRTRLVLRSGAIFFSDHGVYARGLAAMETRGTAFAGRLSPVLRLWAEVLSVPEPDLVICGLGMRDAASDQGLPIPLRLWRDGEEAGPADGLRMERFNDQHGFLRVADGGPPPRVGDVVEFGLSHPCTNFDRHGLVWGLGAGHRVRCIFPTAFG